MPRGATCNCSSWSSTRRKRWPQRCSSTTFLCQVRRTCFVMRDSRNGLSICVRQM